jgi:hypothetical protein
LSGTGWRSARPGELVGIDCFFVGRLAGTKGSVWPLSAIDVASSFAWAELVSCPHGNPTGLQSSRLARQVATDLAEAGWQLERVLTDNCETRWRCSVWGARQAGVLGGAA